MRCTAIIITAMVSNYLLFIFVAVFLFFFVGFRWYYLKTAREVKRLEAIGQFYRFFSIGCYTSVGKSRKHTLVIVECVCVYVILQHTFIRNCNKLSCNATIPGSQYDAGATSVMSVMSITEKEVFLLVKLHPWH